MTKYDVIVVGLGAMGSAAAYQLAKRGCRVLGLDRYGPPHTFGSSHGDTRITRLAIGEGVHYSPLAMRSHKIWREIEAETGASLLHCVGGLMISSPTRTSQMHVDDFFGNTVAAAETYKIPHSILDANAIRSRFPEFNVTDDERAYFEPDAGYLRPEKCIAAQLSLAKKYGAELRTNEKALSFDASKSGVTITTDRGSYTADRLVLTAGAWLPQMLGPKLGAPFTVRRQVLFWFDVDGPQDAFLPGTFPIFIWELQQADNAIYGFPIVEGTGGVKIATAQYETATTPDTVGRRVSPAEAKAMHRSYVAGYFPRVSDRCLNAVACLYTVTPDAGFVIDRHPEFSNVIIASPCSGHGFKHSAAIGEALSALALGDQPRVDLSAFTFKRLLG